MHIPISPYPHPLCALVPQVLPRSRSLQCSRSGCGHTTTSPASRPLIAHPVYLYPVLSGESRALRNPRWLHSPCKCAFVHACSCVCETKPRLGPCGYGLVAHAGPVPLDLGLLRRYSGGGPLVLLQLGREVLPFAPAVKVDKCLHAAPLHDLALEPDEVDGLCAYSILA